MTTLPGTEDLGPDRPRIYLPKAVSVSIIGTFVIVLTGAIYYARDFFLPLLLALLVAMTFMPMVRYFARRGVPAAASAVVLVLLIAGVGALISIALAEPVSKMIAQAPEIIQQLKERFAFLNRPLAMLTAAGREVSQIADPPSADGAQRVVLAEPGLLSWAAGMLTGIGATLAATLILAVFLLSSGDLFLQKLVRSAESLSDKKRSLRIVQDVQYEVSRYLITITAINVCLGILVGLAMALFGMPNPIAWGVTATLLNYIPYVGPISGIVFTLAVSLITFPTLTQALFPPLTYLALTVAEGNVLTPLTLGRRLELNAVAILVALAFFGWMWGVIGVIMGVPLLVVVKVFCDHFPRLATFGEFLSAELPAEPASPPAPQAEAVLDREAKAAGSS